MCISVLLARTYAHCVYGLQLLATVSFYMRLRTKSRSSAWTIHVFNHWAIFPIVLVVCLRMRVGSQAHNSRHPLMPAEEDKSFGAGVAGEWEPLDMSASNRMWILCTVEPSLSPYIWSSELVLAHYELVKFSFSTPGNNKAWRQFFLACVFFVFVCLFW